MKKRINMDLDPNLWHEVGICSAFSNVNKNLIVEKALMDYLITASGFGSYKITSEYKKRLSHVQLAALEESEKSNKERVDHIRGLQKAGT